MKKIKFGVGIATGTEGLMYPIPYSSAQEVVETSVFAEKLGFDSVWGNDHVQTQQYVVDEFGKYPRYYAPLLELSAIAQRTTTLELCTALLVIPFRHPVVMAKELATLDQLSGGRVKLGVGIGAYREEFESQYGREASKVNRGELLEESIQLMHRIFTEDCVTHEGKYFSVRNLISFPKPVQNPFPFYFGGNSEKSFERVVKFGRGWLPAGLTTDEIRYGVSKIKELCDVHGRDFDTIDIAPQIGIMMRNSSEEAHRTYRNSQHYKHGISLSKSTYKGRDIENYAARRMVGSPDEVLQRINDYIEAGVTHFAALLFADNTLEESKDHMQHFAEEILPHFR
ncbi:MAG: LLM class flavin-dependent oxidoreductase [Lawsonibacter sp.]|nr:LLM class flavin-dependent oxidoreductase [Lawsonibacter sp.]